jgi:hypothetical protein
MVRQSDLAITGTIDTCRNKNCKTKTPSKDASVQPGDPIRAFDLKPDYSESQNVFFTYLGTLPILRTGYRNLFKQRLTPNSVADPNPHVSASFCEARSGSHRSEKLDTNPHQCQKRDPDRNLDQSQNLGFLVAQNGVMEGLYFKGRRFALLRIEEEQNPDPRQSKCRIRIRIK